jgi:hypothetical protein
MTSNIPAPLFALVGKKSAPSHAYRPRHSRPPCCVGSRNVRQEITNRRLAGKLCVTPDIFNGRAIRILRRI